MPEKTSSNPLAELLAHEIASPTGPLCLRLERPDDEAFRFALFRDSRPEFALLPESVREPLLRQQFGAQTIGYAAAFPDALSIVIEHNRAPAGRLVVEESADAFYIVDVAFLPAVRGKGAGGALLAALIQHAGTTGRAVRLHVSTNNPGAERLYLRLGFKPVSQDAANTEMEWKAP